MWKYSQTSLVQMSSSLLPPEDMSEATGNCFENISDSVVNQSPQLRVPELPQKKGRVNHFLTWNPLDSTQLLFGGWGHSIQNYPFIPLFCLYLSSLPNVLSRPLVSL